MKAIAVLLCVFLYVANRPALATNDPANQLFILDLPKKEWLKRFDTLLASQVPSREEAREIAGNHWFHNHGYLAQEGMGVTGLYRIGRDIQGLGKEGEWVWEIRVNHLGGGFDGVMYINAHTKTVFSLGPQRQR